MKFLGAKITQFLLPGLFQINLVVNFILFVLFYLILFAIKLNMLLIKGVVGGQIQEEKPGDTNVVSPILWFTDQVRRPGVGVRDFRVIEKRAPTSPHNLF